MVEKEQAPASGRYLSMDPETEAREATWNLYIDDSPECQKAIALLQENGIKFRLTRPDRSKPPAIVPYLVAEPLDDYDYIGLEAINIFVERGLDTRLRERIRWTLENAVAINREAYSKWAQDDLDWLKLAYLKRNAPAIRERIRQLAEKLDQKGAQ